MNQDAKVNFPEKVEFWKLVRVILDFTGWSKEYVFNKSGGARSEEKIFARGLIYYLAISNGCTYVSCGKLTARDHTTVLNSVSKFENRLACEIHSRRFLQQVLSYVNENYHLSPEIKLKERVYYGGNRKKKVRV